MNRLILIFPDHQSNILTELHGRPLTKLPHFEVIRELMGSSKMFLEHIPLRYEGKPAHVFCDEDGLMKGLHPNNSAIQILSGWNPGAHIFLVGPVAIWTGEME